MDGRKAGRLGGEGPGQTGERGHVPGSGNVPWSHNLEDDAFEGVAALRRAYEEAGVSLEGPLITTCGSGVTASLDAFALALLGCEDVAVYDGSWAEWGDRDDTPISSYDRSG